MRTDYVVIREAATHKEVKRIAVKNATASKTDTVVDGIERKLDHGRYYVSVIYGKEQR